MNESAILDQSPVQTTEAPSARKPFVRPTVQDAGGLQDVTLLGGSL
ncbi:MAG TPA: hypothetical protein VF665_16320 [Longimicrobium sp.]